MITTLIPRGDAMLAVFSDQHGRVVSSLAIGSKSDIRAAVAYAIDHFLALEIAPLDAGCNRPAKRSSSERMSSTA